MDLVNFKFGFFFFLPVLLVSLILSTVFISQFSNVEAAVPVRSEMYLGDYEFTKDSSGYSEIKFVESMSGKIVKERKGSASYTTKYYYTNHQGSSVAVLNETGAKVPEQTVSKLRYFAYGDQITSEDSTKLPVDDTYTGQKRDSESDLMFYNARLYDPSMGVFLQADSVADGFNKYMYVGGNPINGTDPSGHVMVDDSQGAGSHYIHSPIEDKYGTGYFLAKGAQNDGSMAAASIVILAIPAAPAAVNAIPGILATVGRSRIVGKLLKGLGIADAARTAVDCAGTIREGTDPGLCVQSVMTLGPFSGGSSQAGHADDIVDEADDIFTRMQRWMDSSDSISGDFEMHVAPGTPAGDFAIRVAEAQRLLIDAEKADDVIGLHKASTAIANLAEEAKFLEFMLRGSGTVYQPYWTADLVMQRPGKLGMLEATITGFVMDYVDYLGIKSPFFGAAIKGHIYQISDYY